MHPSQQTNGPRSGPATSLHMEAETSARLLVLPLGDLCVDAFLVLLAGSPRRAGARLLLRALRLRLLLRVHLLAELLRRLRERLALGFDLVLVFRLEDAFGVLDRRLDLFLLAGVDLVAVLLQRLPHGVYQRLGAIAGVDELEGLLVLGRMRLGILHHALNLGLVQARARLDLDLVLLAGRLVLRRDVQDAVRVDVERDREST